MKENEVDAALESLLDGYGVMKTLDALERVCLEKAHYVDGGGSHGAPSPYLANKWRKVARRIAMASGLSAGL